MGLAILDIGHLGKRTRAGDLGAAADIDRDGVTEPHEREALFVVEYTAAASAELGRLGHRVVAIARDDYADRHARACALAREYAGPTAYVAAHLNVGARYGLVAFDARSAGGRHLAASIGAALDRELELLQGVRVEAADRTRWANAYACIDGIYAGPANLSGVCFEPISMDVPAHAELLRADGAHRIGRALAAGLDGWLRGAG